MKALSFSGSDGSLNWMSYAISFAPSAFRRSMTRAWNLRGSG